MVSAHRRRAEMLCGRILLDMTTTTAEIADMWLAEVERRRENVRTGKSKMIPGEEVFAKVEKRFGR